MPDVNLLSFNGPNDDGRRIDLAGVIDGTAYASAFKCSTGLINARIYADEIIGGHDCCIDVNNNCYGLVIDAKVLRPTGQFAVSIKGNSDDITVAGELHAHGTSADVEIGGWSDQSHESSDGNTLEITSMTGRPVTIRVLHAKEPFLIPGTGPYKYLFPSPRLGVLHTLIVWGFETLRRWGLFRKYAN